jgi:hypothetical protein
MASTYSPNLRLELIGTGEQQGTWGTTTNTNLGTLLEEAIGGYASVTVSNVADTTLTTNNGSADESRNMVINLTGTISATRNVICPAIEKLYVVKNATTGGFAVTFKVSGQTGVSIPNGSTYFLYVDGIDARLITGSLANQLASSVSITGGTITGITDLAVADGGTGSSTAAGARTNLGAAASGANTDITSIALNNTGLTVRDTDASHFLSIVPGSNLSANRTLTVTTGDAARTLDISASNVTVSTAGAALIDDANAAAQRTTLGLGTIATQNANSVSITGGSVTGITDIAIADGGTGASDAATARTNLGLGTVSTQNSNNVSITGGSITGITDIAVADGGTGSSTAAGARTNLGAAASGTNTDITSITLNNTGLGVRDTDGTHVLSIVPGSNLSANRTFTLTTGDAARTLNISAADVTISTAGAALIDDANAAAQRTTLGLGTIATQNANAVSITGGSISGITDLAIADGGTGASDAATARTNLGLGTIATQNANNVSITGGSVTNITDLAVADGGTGASTAVNARTNLGIGTIGTQNSNAVSITGGSITGITDLAIADGGTGASDAATARTNLGLGTIATQNANSVSITGGSITGITDLAIADGGTGASDAATARTNLGLGTAATLNVGTSANNVVQLNASAQIPAVSGALLTGIDGRLIRSPRFLTSGTSYTTPANCTKIFVEAVGGGASGVGFGGGGTGGGSGGGGGGYAARYFTVTANTAYTYAIGAGGVGGTAIAAGGNTTFTVGGTTITGGGATSASGGVGTNGDTNITAKSGQSGNSTGTSPLFGGGGGASFFGPGGNPVVGVTSGSRAGDNGYLGGGGGGAADTSGTASFNGGNGGAGAIRIWEYT